MEKVVNLSHSQRDKAQGERTFEIFNGHYLHVYLTNRKNKRDFAIDLIFLEPDAETEWRFAMPWLWGVLGGLLLAAGVVMAGKMDIVPGLGVYATVIAAVAVLAAVGAATMFVRTMQRFVVFRTRFAAMPIVEIALGNPDAKSCTRLINELKARIARQIDKVEASEEQLRAGELRALRRLANRRIVSEKQYVEARNLLLGST